MLSVAVDSALICPVLETSRPASLHPYLVLAAFEVIPVEELEDDARTWGTSG